MSDQISTNAFFSAPDAYDDFMGRYSKPLAAQFVKSIPLKQGDSALDLGCGPGALTGELVSILGAENVSAVDPSPPFLDACVAKYPGIIGKVGRAEELPFADRSFDAVLSQLVLHFIEDIEQAGKEIIRVTRPGGSIAICTWIFGRMEMVAKVFQAVSMASSAPPPEPRVKTFDEDGQIAAYLTSIGAEDVSETVIQVQSRYADFDELWRAQQNGIGPLGPWMQQQSENEKSAIKEKFFELVGSPVGEFSLSGAARVGIGRAPA